MSSTDHYHIKLELYPTPTPLSGTARNQPGGGGGGSLLQDRESVWRPTTHSNIFDELPSHPRRTSSGNSHKFDTSQTRGGVGIGTEGGSSTSSSEETSSTPPDYRTGIGPNKAIKDWRFGRINIESFDLARSSSAGREQAKGGPMEGNKGSGASEGAVPKGKEEHAALLGPNLGGVGSATKGKYIPLDMKNTEAGWGIVHLYKESVESTPITKAGALPNSASGGSSASHANAAGVEDEDGTILCIPSVPGYISPTDFLSWVGDKWREDVSHYRMVMTSTTYRYMVLMKLQDHNRAVAWQREFAGKPFPGIQAELCQVAFIKSITVETPHEADTTEVAESSKSNGKNKQPWGPSNLPSVGVVNSNKPFPPPTPDLTELPTCSVCLERMDNTAGLVTIPCQHIFHCTCLQTWKGSGCPICRATTPATRASTSAVDPNDPSSRPFGTDISNVCYMCNWNEDLWICLICGNVGCGRYRGGHAKEHWKNTAHSFSLELETQYVWDYASDSWVHRLLRNKDEKVVELPSTNPNQGSRTTGSQQEGQAAEDVVPRAKLENLSVEYTTLYSKQLESQRLYFEDLVNKARDKAAESAKAAEQAASDARKAIQALTEVREEYRIFRENAESTIPSLEKEVIKEKKRADKSAELSRKLTVSLKEEKAMTEGLLEKVKHLEEQMKDSVSLQEMTDTMTSLLQKNKDLEEELADLRAYITGVQQVEKMKEAGEIDENELNEGTIVVPQKETPAAEATDPGSSSNTSKKGKKGKGKGKN